MRNTWNLGTEGLFESFTASLRDAGGTLTPMDRESRSHLADYLVQARFGAATLELEVDVALIPPRSRAEVTPPPSDDPPRTHVLVAPFLSPTVRDELTRSGWSYADATGNLRIRSSDPAVWIDRVGASRNPDPPTTAGTQVLRSLKGKVASEVVVRLLTDGRSPSVRELSRQTGAGLGTVSRVVDLLRSDALLVDTQGGPIIVDDPLALARRWARDYSFEKTFKPNRYFSLLGEEVALDRLQRSDVRYALTGGRGAAVSFTDRGSVPPLPPVGTWLYTDDSTAVERTMDLVPDGRGDILVARCDFLSHEREGSRETKPRLALPWRIVGDLLAAGGRLSALGEELAAAQLREIVAP